MNSLQSVADYLTENAVPLASDLVEQIIKKFDFDVPRIEIDLAKDMYVEFLRFLGSSIHLPGEAPDELIEWSKINGERAANSRGRISDIFVRYPDTRLVFSDFVMDLGREFSLQTDEVIDVLKKVNHMLDLSINETVFAFERKTEELISKTQKEINELSTPIVPIQDSIAVLPLIGGIDHQRTEHLLNNVVPKIPGLKIKYLIIDFSGIITIDTEVAGHIFNVYNVLKLLGIEVIVTGIRTELAVRVVEAGIDFSSIIVHANVKKAIDSIL
ncbi:STAS domain-containing protein [Fictibacillus aquaticus]|uniref:Anti-anti-sigma factor n=1 Tax=Fictibacillus aquaticus TaxID=2021314 RepID=A0A235F651_9BACL|nr:STAS domain-containing protein [Fictibacillus aquaticus]OYD56195.1 anti-anti-sigma factor [Fictibacillus aquaticus]